ncbi:MAG: hypothetical protein H0U25_09245 [Thermoleophilaceae bacterium]|nr:hypothetical protein [Thermoleophilaceae bacterium]
MKNSMKPLPVLLCLLLSLALAAPAAFAQSSKEGYRMQGPSIVDRTGGPDAPPANDTDTDTDTGTDTRTATSGELPFTGLDLGLLGVAGASLLLMGAGMRRMTRSHDSA